MGHDACVTRQRKVNKQMPVQRLPNGQSIVPAEPHQSTDHELRQVQRPWPLTDAGIFAAALSVAGIGIAALVGMWLIADDVTGVDRAKLQIEALKYGLGFFAAAGAVAALLLAVRRQRLAEHAHELSERNHQLALQVQAHTETDAAARRVTDLYTKAIEQIGHADAAVRLGGLYALERVAQNNPDQRQTIVNVLCAYLRMPYVLPSPQEPTARRAIAPPSDSGVGKLPSPSDAASSATAGNGQRAAYQELQVRLTAQRILAAHLAPHPVEDPADAIPANPGSVAPTFWPNMTINLTGATLGDWYFTGCRVSTAWFDDVTFTGHAWFDDATFTGEALFRRATFTTEARFQGATFVRSARFNKATFASSAVFSRSTFRDLAWFDGAAFTSGAAFERTAFTSNAWFVAVTFGGKVNFDETSFSGDEAFDMCRVKMASVLGLSGLGNVWPAGWRPVSEDGLVGTLVQDDAATSPRSAPAGQDPAGADRRRHERAADGQRRP
jgi:uncharacterized protein YjbI with pentapeptide repeats